jgi:flagellar biosynthesis protein FliR
MMAVAPATFSDLLTTGGATSFILLATRVGGLVLIAPVFSSKSVPRKLRTAILIVFAVVLVPIARVHAHGVPALTPLTMLSETLIGFALGIGSAVAIGAASAAGDMMSVQMGLAGASVFDPMTNIQVPVLGQFMTAFASLLLFSSGGHLVMLDGLGTSLDVLPLGVVPDLGAGLFVMSKLAGQLVSLGVMFAAPVMASTMLTNVALAILTRAAPQLQIITVAFPLQIAAGLFTLSAGVGLTAVWFSRWQSWHDGLLEHILGPMLGTVR